MEFTKEQEMFDVNSVKELIDVATDAGKLREAIIAFGNHRETGCTASESVTYALDELKLI